MSDRITGLLSQLTLEEKVALLAGSDMWHTTPIPRLDIPALKVSDGPNGARGGMFSGGVTAACFPVGSALGASWNPDLVQQVGAAIGEEAQTKGARVILAPTVNLHRTPLGGRNFECYSEDPYLTGVMATAYIEGVQSRNVGATIKHYACNDQEFERNTISSEITERPLRELYLRPFQMAIRAAKPWCVMSSYNKINGVYACDNAYLLTDILRGEWGFDGLVMSDWFGTKSSAESIAAGQDLEMPGPTMWRGEKAVQAVNEGKLSVASVDACARRVLELLERAGCFDDPMELPETAVDRPEHRALIRRAGAEGAVLLKNEGEALPIDADKEKKVAVIGPNAAAARIMGGGSSRVNAHYRVSPLEGIRALAGDRFEVGFAPGCTNDRSLPLIPTDWMEDGRFTAHYYNSTDLTGPVVGTVLVTNTEQVWQGAFREGLDAASFSARMEGTITAPASGAYRFGVITGGKSRLYLDGALILDNWMEQKQSDNYFGMAGDEVAADITLEQGRSYPIVVEYTSEGATGFAVNRLGCRAPLPEDAIGQAATLAAASDVAVVFAGLSDEWDSEGFDRPDMELPGDQNALIAAVAAANPRTVVVLNVGAPVTMPWLDDVAAVIQMWYPGQEMGNAAADVLFGLAEPSGRLPQTWPVRLEDNPAYINYPGENGKVHYGEGLFIGYRYYEKKKIAPRFPFGFGLGYTDVAFGPIRLSAAETAPGGSLTAAVDVTNTGKRAGAAVVQLYVRDVQSRLVRPEKELKGFAKLHLQPGETATATFTLDRESLAYFDDATMTWVAEAGEFEVLAGVNAADIRSAATFRLSGTAQFGGNAPKKKGYDLNTPLGKLLDDPDAVAVLAKHLPDLVGMADSPQASMARGFSLTMIRGFMPSLISDAQLAGIKEDLVEL
jgi:beta-glucosidase